VTGEPQDPVHLSPPFLALSTLKESDRDPVTSI